MKISCVRHGKPEFQYPHGGKRLWAHEFNRLLDSYDAAGLDWEWNRSRAGGILLEGFTVSSDLPRALETARLLSGAAPSHTSSLYREVPLPRFQDGRRRMPGALFMALSRLGWFLGTMPGPETRRETSRRVALAADELEELCREKKQVCLYAHGFFLWLLGSELRRRKWHTSKRGAYRYLEAAHFLRRA